MPLLEVTDVQYYYSDQGRGKTIVLLHGFMGSSNSWDEITPALSQVHRVVVPDLLGHGSTSVPTDPERYRIERAAEDLAILLMTIGAAPANLVGYSMGARLALYFALTHPQYVNSLILESGSPGVESEAERNSRAANDSKLAEQLMYEGIPTFVERWERLPLFASQINLPEGTRASQRQQRLINNSLGLANSLLGMGTGSQPSVWGKLDALAIPTLLITGELDEKYCAIAERMAQSLPHATLKVVPDAGHNIHLEKPAEYIRIVDEFLRGS